MRRQIKPVRTKNRQKMEGERKKDTEKMGRNSKHNRDR